MRCRVLLVGLEVGCQSRVSVGAGLNDLLKRRNTILLPCDQVLSLKMNVQTHNMWQLLMHGKLSHAPEGFCRGNITCIKIKFDLILGLAKLHSGAIMAFVDVLVDILYGLDGA